MLVLLMISFVNSNNSKISGVYNTKNVSSTPYKTSYSRTPLARQATTEWQPPRHGDVFNGHVKFATTLSNYGYEEMLKTKMFVRNVGVFTIALGELCDILAHKYVPDVKEIKQHTAEVFLQKNPLWMTEPLYTFAKNISVVVTEMPMDKFKEHSMWLGDIVENRRRRPIEHKYNHLFDLADGLISQDEGFHLLHVLRHIKEYPAHYRGPDQGLKMCAEIFDAFEKPFASKIVSDDVQELLFSINKLLNVKKEYLNVTTEEPHHVIAKLRDEQGSRYLNFKISPETVTEGKQIHTVNQRTTNKRKIDWIL